MVFPQNALKNFSHAHRRFLWVVFFISLLILLSFVGEYGCVSYEKNNWKNTLRLQREELTEYLSNEFTEFENEMVRSAEQCARALAFHPTTKNSDSVISIQFATLESIAHQGTTIELYDHEKNLIAWSGDKGVDIDTTQFSDVRNFNVIAGPLYTYALFTLPLRQEEGGAGYIVVKKFFDVNYPLGNRYINNETFASSFSSRLHLKPKFVVSREKPMEADTSVFVIPLKTRENEIVGYALYNAPRLDDHVHSLSDVFQRIRNALYVLLSACVLLLFLTTARNFQSVSLKIFVWTSVIWLFRYVLLWSNVLADTLRWEIFQPSYFASSFGFGIARSIGDLFVTSIVLLGNVLVAFSIVRERVPFLNEQGNVRLISNKVASEIVHIAIALLIVLFTRGYAAVIRSAVFDSTLQYYNPFYIIPTLPLGLMLLSLFIITLAVVSASYGLLLQSFILTKQTYQNTFVMTPWLFVVLRLTLVSVLFGIIHPTPLLTQGTRLFFVLVLLVLVYRSVQQSVNTPTRFQNKTLPLLIFFSVVFFIMTLDEYVHENDRAQVELLARSLTRPVDSWMTFTVASTLAQVSQPEYISWLESNELVEREKLGFRAWANSQLSKEGYNCAITYVDTNGMVISDFHLGEVRHKSFDLNRLPQSIEVEEQFLGGLSVKTYRGFMPLVSKGGTTIGGVFVEVTANRQVLFDRESPEILRNYTENESRTRSRTIVYSEYHTGELVYSSSDDFPYSRKLSNELQQSVSAQGGLWVEENIEGRRYESYYFPTEEGIIALSLEYLTLQWHLFVIIRILLFFLLIVIGILLVVVLASRLRQKHFQLSVRTKLLLAFVIISLIPIAILAYYNRIYAVERSEKNLVNRLRDETELVVSSLQNNYGYGTPSDLDRLTDSEAEQIAADINLDFHVFRGVLLSATSKPEVFAAELFDERLSGSAFLNLLMKKKNFFYEQRFVGTLAYLVGYRPLHAQSGEIIGIVSVPTIFRQRAIYDELLERNAYLFSVYAIAVILSLGFGWLFANQISAPVRRLQQAARRVSSGDLNVAIASQRTDEFGELEHTFDTMVNDLRESQEHLVRVQREQAWKEMAKQVAHEIKNPLTPMKLSLQHLRQAYNDGVRDFGTLLNQITDTVLAQIESLSKIASEFSHFARMPERKPEECDVHHILHEVSSLFQQHSGLKFSLVLKASKSLVRADREELRRAFINIIRNAVQAMNEKGTIIIETGAMADIIEIRISDTGPGIPEEIRDRLFEPNFSTKTEGMGLGLAIVKKVIDDLSGTITIESTLGKGTTVIIQFPLCQNNET